MVTIDKTVSQSLDLLRFPLSILVVYLHIDPIPTIVTSQLDWTSDAWLSVYYIITISIVNLARIAVPCFFFISGFLFFANTDHFTIGSYLTKLQRRVRSLFIPYILWNILGAVYLYVTQHIACDSFSALFLAPANFPLWFLRDLIGIVIISPLCYWMIRYLKVIGLVLMTLLFVSNVLPPLWNGLFSSFFYFYIGAYCGCNKIAAKGNNKFLYVAFLLLWCTTFLLYGTEMNRYFMAFFLLVGVFSFLNFSYALTSKHVKIFAILSSSSFFIYVAHKLGATYIAKSIFELLPDGTYVMSLRFLIAPFLAALICVGVYKVWRRLSPSTLSIFLGRK